MSMSKAGAWLTLGATLLHAGCGSTSSDSTGAAPPKHVSSSGGSTVHHGFLGMSDSGGCSVSAVGSDNGDGLEGLALVGLGLAFAASRRRRV